MATGKIQYHNNAKPDIVDCENLHPFYKNLLIETAKNITKNGHYKSTSKKSFLKNIPNFTKSFPFEITFCILEKDEIIIDRDSIIIGHIKNTEEKIHITTKQTLSNILHEEKRALLNKLVQSIDGIRFCTVEWFMQWIDYERTKTVFLLDDLCRNGLLEHIEICDKKVMISAYRKIGASL